MRTLEWDSKDTLIDAIGGDIDLTDLIEDPFSNYEISFISDFYAKEDKENLVALDFEVKRTDLMSGWNETEQFFSGRIELEKKMDNLIKLK